VSVNVTSGGAVRANSVLRLVSELAQPRGGGPQHRVTLRNYAAGGPNGVAYWMVTDKVTVWLTAVSPEPLGGAAAAVTTTSSRSIPEPVSRLVYGRSRQARARQGCSSQASACIRPTLRISPPRAALRRRPIPAWAMAPAEPTTPRARSTPAPTQPRTCQPSMDSISSMTLASPARGRRW
jgi:hypothetical protein